MDKGQSFTPPTNFKSTSVLMLSTHTHTYIIGTSPDNGEFTLWYTEKAKQTNTEYKIMCTPILRYILIVYVMCFMLVLVFSLR